MTDQLLSDYNSVLYPSTTAYLFKNLVTPAQQTQAVESIMKRMFLIKQSKLSSSTTNVDFTTLCDQMMTGLFNMKNITLSDQ